MRGRNLAKGALAGVAGGLVASWVMNQFQALWSKAGEALSEEKPQGKEAGESEDATQKAADKVSRKVLKRELSRKEKQTAGPVIHFAFGGAMGALYGFAAEVAPLAKAGAGLPFGAALGKIAKRPGARAGAASARKAP